MAVSEGAFATRVPSLDSWNMGAVSWGGRRRPVSGLRSGRRAPINGPRRPLVKRSGAVQRGCGTSPTAKMAPALSGTFPLVNAGWFVHLWPFQVKTLDLTLAMQIKQTRFQDDCY